MHPNPNSNTIHSRNTSISTFRRHCAIGLIILVLIANIFSYYYFFRYFDKTIVSLETKINRINHICASKKPNFELIEKNEMELTFTQRDRRNELDSTKNDFKIFETEVVHENLETTVMLTTVRI